MSISEFSVLAQHSTDTSRVPVVILWGCSRKVEIFLSISLAPKLVISMSLNIIVINTHPTPKNSNLTLLSIVIKATKTYLSRLKPRTDFRDCGLCLYSRLFETNNFCLRAVPPSCFVSEQLEPTLPEIKLRTFMRSFYHLLLLSRN